MDFDIERYHSFFLSKLNCFSKVSSTFIQSLGDKDAWDLEDCITLWETEYYLQLFLKPTFTRLEQIDNRFRCNEEKLRNHCTFNSIALHIFFRYRDT